MRIWKHENIILKKKSILISAMLQTNWEIWIKNLRLKLDGPPQFISNYLTNTRVIFWLKIQPDTNMRVIFGPKIQPDTNTRVIFWPKIDLIPIQHKKIFLEDQYNTDTTKNGNFWTILRYFGNILAIFWPFLSFFWKILVIFGHFFTFFGLI